jgi:undecaprenyl-diphosphatase
MLQRLAAPLLKRFKRSNLPVLLVVLGIAGALYGFAELSDDVFEGDTRTVDQAVLLWLRSPGDPSDLIGPAWLEEVARDVTSLGSRTVLTLITLSVASFLALTRRCWAAGLLVISIAGGGALSRLLKQGFDRPRPDIVPHAVDVYSASYPSGHAMVSTIAYLTLAALLSRVQETRRASALVLGWGVLLSALIGISRVYLGVHWPTDVLAGWCVGSAWALLCGSVALWLEGRYQMRLSDQTPVVPTNDASR